MEDLELVQRCAAKDKPAWNEFVTKFSHLIYGYIYHILKKKGFATEEDTVNELFQGIFLLLVRDNFRKLKSFRGRNGCSLASWLRQVAINFTLDYLRKRKPSISLDDEYDDGLSLKDIIPDDSLSSTDIIETQEKLAHLEECIERLNSQEKFFLELYLNKGVGLDEIRKISAVSRSAIDMRKNRLIQRLRECFRSKGFLADL